jgi:hypothetical protein
MYKSKKEKRVRGEERRERSQKENKIIENK